MKQVTLSLEDEVFAFYARVGRSADRPVEQVMADALLRLAGELASAMRRPIDFPQAPPPRL